VRDNCKEGSGIQQIPSKISKKQSKFKGIEGGNEERKEMQTSVS